MHDDAGGRFVVADVAGERMWLLADRALYWERHRRLFLSDLHLGKGDVFRRAGVGLPAGGTAGDLDRLARAIALTDASSVWILGDVVHGAVHDSAWRGTWHRWRQSVPEVAFAALSGNHDRALAGAGLGVELLGEAVDDGPFALRHDPDEPSDLHVIGGHLHPCIGIRALGPRRFPVFWLKPRASVLPAFSEFTGGCQVEAGSRDGIVVCAGGTAAWVRRPRSEPAATRGPRRA